MSIAYCYTFNHLIIVLTLIHCVNSVSATNLIFYILNLIKYHGHAQRERMCCLCCILTLASVRQCGNGREEKKAAGCGKCTSSKSTSLKHYKYTHYTCISDYGLIYAGKICTTIELTGNKIEFRQLHS